MRRAIRSIWNEPAAPNPPPPQQRDWALTAIVVVAALVEATFHSFAWKPTQLVLTLAVAFALPWRRTYPFVVAGFAFTAFAILNIASAIAGVSADEGLYAGAFMLILPYTLLRWGSGRTHFFGVPLMVLLPWTSLVAGSGDVGETIAGTVFFLFPAELGVAVRYWHKSRERAIGQARLQERELLARELHDTVAHHVSAIAIQAQAGRTLATTDSGAAFRALATIEQEASRTLAEMRSMVGVLRRGEPADMTPQRGVADIARLAAGPERPLVSVELSGELSNLQPAVDAALYRLAQESITNARRHAKHATQVVVRVAGDGDNVRLTVSDDGAASVQPDAAAGFGLAGMAERTRLLGGTFAAGPHPERGWVVDAVVPRDGRD